MIKFSLHDIFQMKKESISDCERIRYNLYLQGFCSVSDLFKKRDEHGQPIACKVITDSTEKGIFDSEVGRYNRYLCGKNMPKKAYIELCERLNISIKPSLFELDAIKEYNSLLHTEKLLRKPIIKPSNNEIRTKIELAKKAEVNTRIRYSNEDYEQLVHEQDLEQLRFDAFIQYVSTFPVEIINRLYDFSFIFNAENYDFSFICLYADTAKNGRKLIHQSLLAQLEDYERYFYDEWTSKCLCVSQNANDNIAVSSHVLLKSMYDSWGYKYVDCLDELNSLIQSVTQFSVEDWECIKMYHQLCINNISELEKIEFAMAWISLSFTD